MAKRDLLKKALNSPNNLRFGDMTTLAESFGFRLSRTSGSHHIYVHPRCAELLNLQNVGGKAKAYQVRQFLRTIERYNLQPGG
jgi:predicted RNA binding protein YcfA (HicA-like mRNA interferase family)